MRHSRDQVIFILKEAPLVRPRGRPRVLPRRARDGYRWQVQICNASPVPLGALQPPPRVQRSALLLLFRAIHTGQLSYH